MKNNDDWDKLNKGKSYHELLEESLKKTEKKRKERMDAALEAKRERKKKGVNIFIAGSRMTSSI